MSLNVETGSGSATAESYSSVADADTYLAARGHTAWAALANGAKEIALRQATDYMQQYYGGRWAGLRTSSTQALDWPRAWVPLRDTPFAYVANNTIPAEVKNACISLALRASTSELAPDIEPQTTSETVGPISVTYAAGSRQTVRYQAIDNMLAAYLTSGANMAKVVRA